MFFLISYDIEDDKKRNRIAKIMEDYGKRVQFSVFECLMDMEQLNKLKNDFEKIIDKEKDSIRIYRLCENCQKLIEVIGEGEITKDLDFYII